MFLTKGQFTFISGSAEPNAEGKVYPKCNIDQNGETLTKVSCTIEHLQLMERFKDYIGTFALIEYGTNKSYKLIDIESIKD
ncbi:hypothetical protein MUJ63_05945 [Lachnospiraceae bacterium NSJ-143]|nr:hypothetical protein [Lachnospiraceae bacterium NSJ-143]